MEIGKVKKIAIFASGSGSNAQSIYNYFSGNAEIEISLLVCNKPDAFVLERAKKWAVTTHIVDKQALIYPDQLLKLLIDFKINLIVLAGFLWMVPAQLIAAFPKHIINIHPALLPNFGGKGMFGMRVHEAVKNAGDSKSGITIHYVNENYDEGEIIYQAECEIGLEDSPEEIAKKVLVLEHYHYPRIIEKIIRNC